MEQQPDSYAPAPVPADVAALTHDYVTAINSALPGVVCGVYLHGSVTLGAYNPARSDIYIVTVLHRPLSTTESAKLVRLHRELRRHSRLAYKLQIQYPYLDDVRARRYDALCLTLSSGKLNRNPGRVMVLYWRQIREQGICLYGPPATDIVPKVTRQAVREEMWSNLNRYLVDKTRTSWRWAISPMAVEFAVLTACRILYTLATESITSKEMAGEYAIKVLPAKWHRPVQEALRIRQGTHRHSLYRDPLSRSREVKAFILGLVTQCNQLYLQDISTDSENQT